MNTKAIDDILKKLANAVTRLGSYEDDSPLQEVALELVQRESFVVGMLHSLLEEQRVDPEDAAFMRISKLDGAKWVLQNGARVKIENDANLLKHARLIEEAEHECLKLIDGIH